MEMGDYKEIKRNLDPKIEAMLTQYLSFNQIEVEYKSYLKNGTAKFTVSIRNRV